MTRDFREGATLLYDANDTLMTFGDLFKSVGTLEADVIFFLFASKKQANWASLFLYFIMYLI
jgi:hypothetical protein